MIFNRSKLHSGMIIAVRSHSLLGWAIRAAEDRWEARTCARLGVPACRVWSNHTGILIGPDVPHLGPDWCVGEALAQGSVLTPLEDYERGTAEARVFEVLSPSPVDARAIMWQAALNWTLDVESHPYDYWAYPGLIAKALLGWRVSTGDRHDFYCTEGVARAFRLRPPGFNVLQDSTPAPFHVEQCAGLLPRPAGRLVTLRERTDVA